MMTRSSAQLRNATAAAFVFAVAAVPAHAQAVTDTTALDSLPRQTAAALEPVIIRALTLPGEIRTAPWAAARNGPDVARRARPGLALTEPLHGIAGVQVDNRFNFSLGERLMVRGFGARTQFGIRGILSLIHI